jgi:hypothetical protein
VRKVTGKKEDEEEYEEQGQILNSDGVEEEDSKNGTNYIKTRITKEN